MSTLPSAPSGLSGLWTEHQWSLLHLWSQQWVHSAPLVALLTPRTGPLSVSLCLLVCPPLGRHGSFGRILWMPLHVHLGGRSL